MKKIHLSDHFTYAKLLRFVLPSIIMMLCTSCYSIIDGFFVSNYAGKTAFAAVNLIMPIAMGGAALGFLIGTGGSAIVSKTLGEGKAEKANQYFTMLVSCAVIGGLTISVLGFILLPPIAWGLKDCCCKTVSSMGGSCVSHSQDLFSRIYFRVFLWLPKNPL